MKRIAFIAVLMAAIAAIPAGNAQATDPRPDFSRVDPAWAAQELDRALQEGEMGSAWGALKVVFPDDYRQLTQDMANALIQNREWQGVSQAFLQAHVAGQIQTARRAPAQQQLKYQRKKADFLKYLSTVNIAACAYLGSGRGDGSSLETLDSDQMTHYSDLIAVLVETIGAGLKSPVVYSAPTVEDLSEIKAVMSSQGVTQTDIERILSGETGATTAEQCRIGVVWHGALAATPAEITAKIAFGPSS